MFGVIVFYFIFLPQNLEGQEFYKVSAIKSGDLLLFYTMAESDAVGPFSSSTHLPKLQGCPGLKRIRCRMSKKLNCRFARFLGN